MHRKHKNRDCCVCTCVLPLVKCTRPLADSILISRLALSHSIPPPPPPLTYLTSLSILHLFGICQTSASPTPTPHPHSPLPTHHHPTQSRLHAVWCHPSSTISLNSVNHSHGRSKHHEVSGSSTRWAACHGL